MTAGGRAQPHLGHPYQRLQLPMVDQAELPDEVVKVLVAGVDVSLGTHVDDAVKVMDVDVDEDTEEAGEDLSANLLELLGEGDTCKAEARWKPFHHFWKKNKNKTKHHHHQENKKQLLECKCSCCA